MRKLQKKLLYVGMLMLVIACLAGCAESKVENEGTEDTQTEVEAEPSIYLIKRNDVLEEKLTLYSYETGLDYAYTYDSMTQFKNKYGDYISSSAFVAGKIVEIGDRDTNGCLKEIKLTDQVWEYEGVKRFSFDSERGVFSIADTNYSIREQYFIFSNGERINTAQISENDVLTVIGKDTKILSMIVTTGHGTLSLINTELFEGSFLQLNNNIFTMITQNMDMEVEEGVYVLTVANDGWGGTKEIEIVRGETTEVDLEELKGEGKKKGIIHFDIEIEDVSVYVDRELIDHNEGVELTYGMHQIKIEAAGYSDWKKYLVVNSPEATIEIELENDKDSKPKVEEKESEEMTEEDTTEAESQGV